MLVREEGAQPPQTLEYAARTYHRYPEPGPWVIRSVGDWEARHTGFAFGQAQAMIAADSPAGRRFRADLASYPSSEALILAADTLARSLNLSADRLAPALRQLLSPDSLGPQP